MRFYIVYEKIVYTTVALTCILYICIHIKIDIQLSKSNNKTEIFFQLALVQP